MELAQTSSRWSYEIAESLYYEWRDRLLEGGKAALEMPDPTSAASWADRPFTNNDQEA